jgi:hypothetical protein
VNRKRAHFLQWGHVEVVAEQPDGNSQDVVFIVLLLERALHLGELFLQVATLHHFHRELVIKTCSKSSTN